MYSGTQQEDLAQYPQQPMAGLACPWRPPKRSDNQRVPACVFRSCISFPDSSRVSSRTATEPPIGPHRPVPWCTTPQTQTA